MQLESLARRLPEVVSPLKVVEEQGQAFEVSPSRVPGFVSPTVSVVTWPENAPVLLIEAGGAVGKSAAAAALAEELKWPLVLAERTQVGDYTLLGLLQDALGPMSTYTRDIALGEAGVVIDALDEAHLRAGTENFIAFIRNAIKVAGAQILPTERRPSIVLFSRSDTADLVRLVFADESVPLAHAHLDFFSHSGACAFIASYHRLRFDETGRPEYNVGLAAPRPFEQLRNGRMAQIARVLSGEPDIRVAQDWERLRDFLGYAPVLIALAESLAVTNPAAAHLDLDAQDEGLLLREIVNFILTREQRKFAEHMAPKLQALLPIDVEQDVVAKTMYTPSEQALRLLSWTAGVTLATALPAALPDAVRGQYDAAVETFLPDHPFVKARKFASVVFEDFVVATNTCDLEARLALAEAPHTLVGRVGPFFARFLAQANSDGSDASIPEGAIEHVIWSWSQEAELSESVEIDVRVGLIQDGSYLSCGRRENDEWVDLSFGITDLTGALSLSLPLRETTIMTDSGLILGSRGSHFQMGPNVLILANELEIEAETLRVAGGNVRIGATTLLANYLAKVETGPEDLAVYADAPPARLRPYVRQLKVDQYSVPYQRYVDFRSIFACFKPTVKGLCAHSQWLENKIVRNNPHRLTMLEQLKEAGIVLKSGDWYQLDVNALDRVGFGLHDLRTGQPGHAVLSFLVRGGHAEREWQEP